MELRVPDDFHVHLRDGPMLAAVAPYTASQFRRALVMPNLQPPIRTVVEASAYRDRILSSIPPGSKFQPLMTLYLTDETSPQEIIYAKTAGFVVACKLYPAGATTNSALGVTSIERISSVLREMEKVGLVLCVHGEVTGAAVDVFDREAEFVRHTLPHILNEYPALKVVLEHVTTKEAVDLVLVTPGHRLAATMTAHHLLYSRNAIFGDAKIHPHMYCLPILKRESHRQALLKAIANDTRGIFFAGTDSAPHSRAAKLGEHGCAGIFTAACAVELYTEAFDDANMMHRLNAFLSENGAKFYGLPLNSGRIFVERVTLEAPQVVPHEINVADKQMQVVVPLRAGQTLRYLMTHIAEVRD